MTARAWSPSRWPLSGPRRWLSLLLALLVSVAGLAALAGPATAAPVYEIEGAWVNAPATIQRGTPVVSEWRINVNDDQPAPSNEPIDNVTATFAVQKAFFNEIPDMCLTTGVTPVSSISADGLSLTCNFGPVQQGTALILQTPVVANGVTNERIEMEGTSPSGETKPLPPILIRNPFKMDMQWQGVSAYENWDDLDAPTHVDVDLEWSLRMGDGSDPGPDSITQRLTVSTSTGDPFQIGTHPNIGDPDNWGVQGCTSHGVAQANGHPYSTVPGAVRHTNFVDSCTLTPVAGQPGVFDLTLTGINYDLLNVSDQDSFGNPLPTDWDYVASGMVWFRVLTSRAGSIRLQANAPTYTAPTGQTSADIPGNNASTKVYTLPGGFSSAYARNLTGNGGTRWDDSYRVAAGTTVYNDTVNWLTTNDNPAPAARYGVCQVLDTQYVDFDPNTPIQYWYTTAAGQHLQIPGTNPGVLEFYTGGVGDPNTHNCGTGTWSTTQPADPATVTAVRWTYPASAVDNLNALGFFLRLPTKIEDDVAPGQDVWLFGSYQRDGTWTTPVDDTPSLPDLVDTPGLRYPATNSRRDLVVVVTAIPAIKKASARSTVTPGVPAEFTLTYSANGAGTIPPEVDDYTIVDTLPAGMTYEPGSATPDPATAMVGGRQVLTWEFDDVTTNVQHPLTYEAVADDSIAPGTPLTNTAVSSLGGESSAPATKTVTTTTNGFTDISKTTDTPFIPNIDGSGDGEGIWTVTLRSNDPLPQAYTDVIDILPYEGDFRGTDYEGSYELTEVEIPTGSAGTVYYATAHPSTLSDDPGAPANGGANTPSSIWSTTFDANATAVRVIGPAMNPGEARQFRVHIATDGAAPKDVYVNRAQGRAEHTRLVMRTSAPMSVAAFYSANLKKYVQDAQGNWRDANDVADYPAFKLGDTVNYRIVITNTGQGTLTNLDIKDDKFTQGSFHVDTLAPGEQRSHEFSSVIPGDATGTLVNTACATADTPADADPVKPTINCDPAGREITNYVTRKDSDPAPGTPLQPGEVVHYTISVTQQGSVPAEAVFTDALADVLDDANYNGDATATIGTVDYVNGALAWKGTIPVGQVAQVTYSVTVKGAKSLGNRDLVNPVTSPGCVVKDGQTINCDTEHPVPEFDLKLRKKIVGSHQVAVGDKVRYKLQVTNTGPDVAPAPITVTDKLPKGLELQAARGTGWVCKVKKAWDNVSCVFDTDLQVGQKAPLITVITKTNKDASDQMINVAKVSANGDSVKSNNRDKAAIRVGKLPPLPRTGFLLPLDN